jgi:hypothetical protein
MAVSALEFYNGETESDREWAKRVWLEHGGANIWKKLSREDNIFALQLLRRSRLGMEMRLGLPKSDNQGASAGPQSTRLSRIFPDHWEIPRNVTEGVVKPWGDFTIDDLILRAALLERKAFETASESKECRRRARLLKKRGLQTNRELGDDV